MRKLWNEYRALWHERPGATTLVHVTVTGGVTVAVLLARSRVAGQLALIAWLVVLAASVKPCLMCDLMRRD